MYRCLVPKLFRLLLVPTLFGILLSSGCVADKQMVPPYQGRAEREVAMQQPGYERPVVEESIPVSPVPATPFPQQQTIADEDLLLPILTHVNERIFSYEQKLAAWKLLHDQAQSQDLEALQLDAMRECGHQMEDILAQYNALHQRLVPMDSVTTGDLLKGEHLLELEKQDFQFLESDCTKTLSGKRFAAPALTTGKTLTPEMAQEIRSAYEDGEFERTIQRYEGLLADIDQPPPFDLTMAYGKALMKTGREPDGRAAFKELLARIRRNDQALWEFQLMQLIGDLNFALGSYDAAQKQYDEIIRVYEGLRGKNDWAMQQLSALQVVDEQSEEVKAYADLLRSHLAYNPDRDGFTVMEKAEAFVAMYPYSLVSSSADHLVTISKEDAEQWYRKLLQDVNDLAAEEKFQDALLLLERVPRTILPIEKQQELAARSAELSTTEAITRETRQLAQEQELQENWNEGMTFLERKEYDQAIEAFNRLLGSSYDERAKKRIDEAAGLAVQEDRKRAAELFVRSNRTHDLESRKKLLLSSRQLLQDILIKYPQSDLIDKVKRNLQRIDEEINALDPTLLSAPVTVNGSIPDAVSVSADSVFEPRQEGGEMGTQTVTE